MLSLVSVIINYKKITLLLLLLENVSVCLMQSVYVFTIVGW